MPSTPPTSPQRHQEAARHTERSARLMASPEQRRTPAGPSAASISAPPPPPVAETSTREPYRHLPLNLAAQWAALPPLLSAPSTGPSTTSTSALPPPPLAQASTNYLQADLAARVAALPPIPSAPRRGRPPSTFALPPVSLIFILIIYI